MRTITIALTVIVAALAGYWGYRWWQHKREAAAQKALSECLYAYQEALQGKGESTWGNVASLCNVGYDQNSFSTLAPYFEMFNAAALLKKGDRENAIRTMEAAINDLSDHSPFLNLYKTKLALVKLDDEMSAQEGLQMIKALAENKNNENRDMALYYLGLYYWTQRNTQDAKVQWKTLVEEFKHAKIGASPWMAEAREKLETMA